MTAIPGEFDEAHDEPQPPLPPEDRLWRHPSELDPLALHPNATTRHRLLSHPARRSALTAGIVGALLASSVAAIVTHLADSLGTPGRPSTTSLALRQTTNSPAISAALAAKISLVSAAMATVEVTRAKSMNRSFGLVIRSNGMLLVPALAVKGADGIIVTLADGDVYVGELVGMNLRSGLAVLRINGASGLPTIVFSRTPIANGSLALAVTAPGADSYALGTIRSAGSADVVDGHALVGAFSSDISAASGPSGRPLLTTSSGTVEGVVTGFDGASAVIAPAWLAAAVSRDLMAPAPAQGWLGIRCATNKGHPAGVRIVWMAAHSSLVTAGLRVGYVIVAVDRTPVSTVKALRARLYDLRPGAKVALTVDDKGAMLTRVIKLAASPNA